MTEHEELIMYKIFSTASTDRRVKRAFKLIENGMNSLVKKGYRTTRNNSIYRDDRRIITKMLESPLLKEIT